MWILTKFSVWQILREIRFWRIWESQKLQFWHFVGLSWDFDKFLNQQNGSNYSKSKSWVTETGIFLIFWVSKLRFWQFLAKNYQKFTKIKKALSDVHNSQCGKTRNSLSPKNISWNQLFSNFFKKPIIFTKFLSKKLQSKFLDIHTVSQFHSVEITYGNSFSHFFDKISWKQQMY